MLMSGDSARDISPRPNSATNPATAIQPARRSHGRFSTDISQIAKPMTRTEMALATMR